MEIMFKRGNTTEFLCAKSVYEYENETVSSINDVRSR